MQHQNHTDLWSMYFKEREGYDVIDTGKGVASYIINGETCYIRDIFIHPDYRHTGEGSLIADAITVNAREKGCKYLTGSVVPSTNGATLSLFAMLKYGFKLKEAQQDFIILIKEI